MDDKKNRDDERATMPLNGVWRAHGPQQFAFVSADGRRHASVYYSSDAPYANRPWVAWTVHTEGNDSFATEHMGKAHAEGRLQSLLRATEPLRHEGRYRALVDAAKTMRDAHGLLDQAKALQEIDAALDALGE